MATKKKDKVLICWRVVDFVLATSIIVFGYLSSDRFKLDGSLYGTAIAVTTAALTIAIFVCTMNYAGMYTAIRILVEKHGEVFLSRWQHIFYSLVGALAASFLGMMLDGFSHKLAVSIAILAIVIALLNALRSINLLLLLVKANQYYEGREKRLAEMHDISSHI